jgi:DNA-3-methyladenine glycosylase II
MKRVYVKKLIIKANPPFDFNLTAQRKLGIRNEEICGYSDQKYWRVLRSNRKLILIVIRSIGTTDAPILEAELKSDQEISKADEEEVKKSISYIFGLDLNLKSFYREMKKDRVMSKIINKFYGLRMGRCPSLFEALVYVITGQQISLRAAHAIIGKFIKMFGDKLKIDHRDYYAFPIPEKVASLKIEDLRLCGMSRRKAEYIHNLAKLITEKKINLEALKYKEDEEIIEELCKIRGIGRWTAELVMIRGMGKLSMIPADDLDLQRHFSQYYFKGRKASSNEIRKISQRWGEWKGLAGYYLIIAGKMGITI